MAKIEKQISEYFYGFFNVTIVPYGSKQPSLGDVFVQKFDLSFGFEIILESNSLKVNSRDTFTANELPEIIGKVNQLIYRTFVHLCPINSKGVLTNISNLPKESSASLARWYERLILNPPEIVVYVQEKAEVAGLC